MSDLNSSPKQHSTARQSVNLDWSLNNSNDLSIDSMSSSDYDDYTNFKIRKLTEEEFKMAQSSNKKSKKVILKL